LLNLPIIAQNSLNLVLVLPGVVRSRQGGSLDSGIGSVNGARARSNLFLIDGALNQDISVAGPAFTITNNDAIQEVAVQTSNFTAEFGRAGGAVVNQITKGGTNSLHGTVAEVYQSEVLNSATQTQLNAFFNAGQTGVLKPAYKENIPAFTIGGPVIIPHLYNGKNKTFFFGAGQWDRFSSGGVQQDFTLPTAAGIATLQPLAATCPNVALLLTTLNGEVAPTALGAPISIAIPNQIANTSCGGGARAGQSVQVGTFSRFAPSLVLDNNHSVRIDHVASQKQTLSFRWLYDDTTATASFIGLVPGFDSNFQGRTLSATFNDTYIINNTWTNEFRFSFERFNFQFPLADSNGIGATLPEITISGLFASGNNLGVPSTFPQGRVANSFQYQDTMSKVAGKHTFRFGGEVLRQLARQVAPFNGRGQIAYANFTPNAAQQVFTGGSITGLANFVDDFVTSASNVAAISFGSGLYRLNLFTYGLFFQDSWKFTPNLTISAGLRYDNFGQPANIFKFPAFTGFCDACVNDGKRVNQDNNNFGPNLGFAYNPQWSNGFLGKLTGSGRTVIRGGYAVSYDTFFNNMLSNMAAGSPNALTNLNIPAAPSAATPRGLGNIRNIIPTLQPVAITPLSTVTSDFNQHIRNPYANRLSFGVQRETFGNMVVDLSYVGLLARQLFYTNPLNPQLPNATNTAPGARLFPNRGIIQVRDSGATSNYHSMQLGVKRPLRWTPLGEMGFTSNYTWSRNMDTASEIFATNSSAQNPSLSPALHPLKEFDYGPSDNDRRHAWVTALQWNVRGPKNGVLGQVLGGWNFSPIITVQSGIPFTVLQGAGADRDFDGSTIGDRPDIGNPNAPVNTRARSVAIATCSTGFQNIDTLACVTTNDVHFVLANGGSQPVKGIVEGRNANYTPGQMVVDANIIKQFKLT